MIAAMESSNRVPHAPSRPTTLEWVAQQAPTAVVLGDPWFQLPDGWLAAGLADETNRLTSWVVVADSVPRLTEVVAALPATTGELWTVIPNPVSTADVVRALAGSPVSPAALWVHDADEVLSRHGWVPLLLERPLPPSPVVGGLAGFLDQISARTGIGGNDPLCARRYVRSASRPERTDGRRPFLSVLVRTQGSPVRLNTLRETLLCLESQTDQDFEVVVLPHQVSDDVLASVETVVDEYRPLLPGRIRVEPVTAPGRSAPLIHGLVTASGHYVAVLDDDDTVMAHWIEAFHDLDPTARPVGAAPVLRARCIGQRMEVLPERDIPGYRAWAPYSADWHARYSFLGQLADNHLPIHSYALPTDELLAWGLHWDPELPVLEDWDLLMRAINILGVLESPEFTSIYRLWPPTLNSQSSNSPQRWESVRLQLLDAWSDRSWIVPPGTVNHAVEAEFARLSARTVAEKVRARAARAVSYAAPRLTGTRLGSIARRAYHASGLRPEPPADLTN